MLVSALTLTPQYTYGDQRKHRVPSSKRDPWNTSVFSLNISRVI